MQRRLATPVLRFQCVERGEAEGEAGVHARESRKTKTGRSSERLAVEQLVALREGSEGADSD